MFRYHDRREGSALWIIGVIAFWLGVGSAIAQPDNDRFAFREVVQGRRPTVYGFTVDASLEPAELRHTRGGPGEGSVWWDYTAPLTGRLAIRASFWNGIWGQHMGARLMLFEGTEIESLRLVAEASNQSILEADVEQGHRYSLAVLGPASSPSFFAFRLDFAMPGRPLNDLLESPTLLVGGYVDADGTTIHATPDRGSVFTRVWWEWTAPQSGRAWVQVFNPQLKAELMVWPKDSFDPFRGFAVARSRIFDDTVTQPGSGTRFTWNAESGVTYVLALQEDLFVPPQDFALRLVVSDAGLVAERRQLLPGESVRFWLTPPSGAEGFRESILYSDHGLILTNRTADSPLSWTPSQSGVFQIQSVFVDGLGRRWPATNTIRLQVLEPQPIPPNDHFAHRELLPGRTNLMLRLDEATVEPGEPPTGQRSVWFEWQPDGESRLVVSLFPQGHPTFEIEAYEGLDGGDLQAMEGRYSTNGWLRHWELLSPGGRPVYVRFSTEDRLYAEVPVSIATGPVPRNDMFANRLELPAGSFRIQGDNRVATIEPGESHLQSRTLWYNWRAPVRGVLKLPRSLPTLGAVAVYSGSQWPPQVLPPRIEDHVPVSDGINYLIGVQGVEHSMRQFPVQEEAFTLEGVFSPSPSNDRYSRPQILRGDAPEFSGDLAGAQPSSIFPFLNPNHRYLWYEWEATHTGDVQVTVTPSFTGEVVAVDPTQPDRALALQAQGGQWIVPVQQGRRYRLGLGNRFGSPNGFTAQLSPRRAAPNNAFSRKIELSGVRASLRGGWLQADREAGEPGGAPPGLASTWWTWKAPATGWVSLHSDELPPVRVFLGDQLEDLAEVPIEAERFPGQQHEARFRVQSGLDYQFAVYGSPQSPFDVWIDLDFSTWEIASPLPDEEAFQGEFRRIEAVKPDPTVDGDPVGPVLIVRHRREPFSADLEPLGTIAELPGSAILTDLVPPSVSFRLQMTNTQGEVRRSLPVTLFVRPENDRFAAARVMVGTNWTVSLDLAGSTQEPDEPEIGPGLGSVWYRWEAPVTGHARILLSRQGLGPLDGNVYQGTSVSTLHEITGWAEDSATSIPISRGASYFFRVSGHSGANPGSLQVEARPYRIVVPHPDGLRRSDVVFELVTDFLESSIAGVRYFTDRYTDSVSAPPYRAAPPDLPLTDSTPVGVRIDFKDGTRLEYPPSFPVQWRPDNDDLSDAARWKGSYAGLVTTAGATQQTGEPAAGTRSATIWWLFESSEDGYVRLSSDNPELVIDAFSAPDADSWSGATPAGAPGPLLMLPVRLGERLQIRVSSERPVVGHLDFRYSQRMTNTTPASAATLPSAEGTLVAPLGASSGEDLYWWIYPERSGELILETVQWVLGDFRWWLSRDGLEPWALFPPRHFPVQAGAAYLLRVGLAPPGFGTFVGNFRIVDLPENHTFERRLTIPPAGMSERFFSGSVPSDPKEPNFPPGVPRDRLRTLWFSWTSPVRQRVDLHGGPAEIGVYVGDRLESLREVHRSAAGYLSFFADAGQAYVLMVRGEAWWMSPYGTEVGLNPNTPPSNDDFANRIPLTGNEAVLTVAGSGGTREFAEPWHGGRPSPASAWWTWAAPADGTLKLKLDENRQGYLWLDVYRGERLADLISAVNEPFELFDTSVDVPVVAGESFQIAVASDSNVVLRNVLLSFEPALPPNTLQISRTGPELHLRWRARPGGVVIESSERPESGEWQSLPRTEGDNLRIPIPGEATLFFRLRPD